MNEKLQLFASLPINKRPRTDNPTEFQQQVTLIAKDGANALKISDLSQFIKDLEGAGIVVSENQIDLIANKTYIRDGKSGTPIALFADGKLNANLIDADTITVNHLYAKSGQGGTVVGHFGNYEKSDAAVGEDKCPLWLGATTAANAPFRVTKDGDMVANSGKIGPFWISPAAYKDSLVSGTFEKNPDTSRFTSYVKLSKSLIELVGKSSFASDVVSGGGFERILMSVDRAKIDGYITPLYIKSEGNASIPETAGVVVDTIGAFTIGSARAFWARKGSYAGFRRDVYSIEQTTNFNAGTMCCEGYGLIIMKNTSNVTITLPSKMDGLEIGSELIIIRGTSNITFSGAKIRQCGKGLIDGVLQGTLINGLYHLYYAGEDIGWFVNLTSRS